MSTKKIVIIIAAVLMAGVAIGWFIFAQESKYFGTSSLRAVPVDTPFFVRIQKIGDYASQSATNSFWKELSVFRSEERRVGKEC